MPRDKLAWNSGLTSKDDPRILAGEKHPNYGIKRCLNTGRTHFKKEHIPWNKGRKEAASQKSVEALVNWVKENGPWNKKYDDPSERIRVYRKKHKNRRAEHQIQYYRRPEIRERYRAKRQALRNEVINALGGRCVRCGIEDIRVLQIDHINGGGVKELRGHPHTWFYRKVIESYAKGEKHYQLLCANCNQIKRYERGEFPHGNPAP